MSASKRPSTSSLRRFITPRPYLTVAELRRRFGLDEPDALAHLQRNVTSPWIGLPEREATKLHELWHRDEPALELSIEGQAPVVVGMYPMRIARYVMEIPHPADNGHAPKCHALNGPHHAAPNGRAALNRAVNDNAPDFGRDIGTPVSANVPPRRPDGGPPTSPSPRAE